MLLLQAESLYRVGEGYFNAYNDEEFTAVASYDVLVLDECNSLIDQFFSTTMHRNRDKNFQVLVTLLRNTPRVVIMDALLSGAALKFIKQFSREIHCQYNQISPLPKKCKLIKKESSFIYKLFQLLAEGKKIYFASYSKLFLDKLKKEFRERKLENYAFYDKDLDDNIKNEHLSDVENYWSKFQFVGVSPTVTVGIDFNKEHFDYVFALVGRNGCKVREIFQMTHRVRKVKENTLYLHIVKPGKGNLPLRTEREIREELVRKQERGSGEAPYFLEMPVALREYYISHLQEVELTQKRLKEETEKYLRLCNYSIEEEKIEAEIVLLEPEITPLFEITKLSAEEYQKMEKKKGRSPRTGEEKLSIYRYTYEKKVDVRKEGAEELWKLHRKGTASKYIDNAYLEKNENLQRMHIRDCNEEYVELSKEYYPRFKIISELNKLIGIENSFVAGEEVLPRSKVTGEIYNYLLENKDTVESLYNVKLGDEARKIVTVINKIYRDWTGKKKLKVSKQSRKRTKEGITEISPYLIMETCFGEKNKSFPLWNLIRRRD